MFIFGNMKRIILATILCLIINISFAQVDSDNENRIFWHDTVKLTWDDFQATSQKNVKVSALSSIGLPYRYITDGEGVMKVYIEVCFIKNESWSIKEEQNNLLLNHEQLHFDIAELHRRLIVRDVLNTEFNKKNYKETLEQIIEKYWISDYRTMQDLYDRETNFSRVVKAQIDWNEKITKELQKLEKYTADELEISLIN
tara:strand:- start:44 stop:640 length:597 start_codon:yes stop_codon:yes gene_type:complete